MPSANGVTALQHFRDDRKLARYLLIDIIIIVLLVIPIIVCESLLHPFHRGVFCDDESIKYPYRENTVSGSMLLAMVAILPLLSFLVVEIARCYKHMPLDTTYSLFGWNVPVILTECLKQFAAYTYGLLLTFNVTEIGKFTMGRLRPYFLEVCQPQFPDGSTCADAHNQQRYMEDYVCVANGYSAAMVREGRLSFPSGHASFTFYTMVYLALYLQRKLTWRGSKLVCHFLQFWLIMMAWFTALSRIIDSWHHWSDVLVGSAIGIIVAVVTIVYIVQLFITPLEYDTVRIGTLRPANTLQEVISTPPPYTVNNTEYCTKI